MRLVHKIGLLDVPGRCGHAVIVVTDNEAVFQYAADFDTGQGEDHFIQLGVADFELHQVRGLRCKRNYGPVRVDGPTLDVGDFEFAVLIGSFDGCQFLAFFRQNLDAYVIAVEVQIVVGCLFPVEIYGCGAWRQRVSGHLQFFFGGFLELRASNCGTGTNDERTKSKRKRAKSHREIPGFLEHRKV